MEQIQIPGVSKLPAYLNLLPTSEKMENFVIEDDEIFSEVYRAIFEIAIEQEDEMKQLEIVEVLFKNFQMRVSNIVANVVGNSRIYEPAEGGYMVTVPYIVASFHLEEFVKTHREGIKSLGDFDAILETLKDEIISKLQDNGDELEIIFTWKLPLQIYPYHYE